MVELPGKKIVFLDDWRFGKDILSFATQCLWYDGSVVPINRPQNVSGVAGHYQYQGTAPIIATTKLADIEKLRALAADDPKTGVPKSAEASMIVRRLKVYPFTRRMPKPPLGLKHCGFCFAKLILTGTLPQPSGATAACLASAHGNVWV